MDKILLAVEVAFNRIKEGEDLNQILDNYKCVITSESLDVEERDRVKYFVGERLSTLNGYESKDIQQAIAVVDPEGHDEWYPDWLEANNNSSSRENWSRLRTFLERKLRKNNDAETVGRIIRSIDDATNKIIDRLEHPSKVEYQTKGLVLGHVQSGKTANFTAVISKAADAGYKLIVVLSGIHNNLRAQTQQRLDQELTGEPDSSDVDHVLPPSMEHKRWVRLTNLSYDFDEMTVGKLQSLAKYRNPMLAVIKKNCTVMNRFLKWVSQAPEDIRKKIPLLVIDDEADQASIDTNYSKDTDPTKTNALIRRVLSKFDKHAYVGYTATPFANVLINMNTYHSDLKRDLYPRNFIISLPRPEGYMGAEQIFAEGKRSLYVRDVPVEEVEALIPKKGKRSKHRTYPSNITPKLAQAIQSFCLASAARYHRGQRPDPMTMLIHTTHYQDGQSAMKLLVRRYWSSLKSRWKFDQESLREEFKELWESDFKKTTKEIAPELETEFEEIEPYISELFEDLEIYELNAKRDADDLDYVKNRDIKVVAIGGNRLSRGLTLEGLTTSFYLRNSPAYDTLLQMGRWFGYRKGYEDLTRVFTSADLADHFEDLALVERELRDEIQFYENDNLTPADLAVRIRDHQKMRITAPNKMGAAEVVRGSFSGRLAQTIWFPLNEPEKLKHNLESGDKLIRTIGKWDKLGKRGYVSKRVDPRHIINFIESYQFDTAHAGLNSVEMLEYIKRLSRQGELQRWTVGVMGQVKDDIDLETAIQYGGFKKGLVPVERSRINQTYKIGVLSDPKDLRTDLVEKGKKVDIHNRDVNEPLLLLYLVNKDSQVKKGTKNKNLVPLFSGISEKVHVLGLVIVFPYSKVEPASYYAQPIKRNTVKGVKKKISNRSVGLTK